MKASGSLAAFLVLLLLVVITPVLLLTRMPEPGGLTVTSVDVPPELVPLIEAAAGTCTGVSPALLAAQLDQESGFRADAVSPVGAQGLAQFMPGTWASWGRDGDGDGRADPFTPADAIPAQAAYLCSLLGDVASLGGDPVRLALAAYNAGLGAVQRYGDVPPFAETQAYVTAVMANVVSLAAPPPEQLGGQDLAGEGCTIDDPTSGGCLTPRAYRLLQHMVNDLGIPIAKITCWDRHAWNPSSLHSRGRACDIMLTPGRWAAGADRAYGDALAAHLTANSDALALGTVIWYAQSWSSWRGTWRPYGGGGVYDVSNATGGHGDHVHVDVR